ncbi:Pre-mRNA-splicing factor 38B [Araneus ventricosus]|uniref:Pre-mRNA-splicing factor 38 n=1 Tax=Araneus ventricosus TaxID=182803 RepID=A0A4Y2GR98_ARAVE|nr:Pre-mRNA-splicing factor 38B [Araneus ventricosus]
MAPGIADKKNNTLPLWGNEKTMNLNNLILTNILSSHYFKVNLYQLKTYHEVIDEIYYKVNHLEPWEKGSRKTAGQTGMCGGVRGVGAGGIVSTAFCILYKLFTLKLTRKQVVGLINHNDSPYIRALGFMYIRYTQPPADLWDWYEPYLEDEEDVDVKAGGGQIMTIGEMLRHFLSKLEWFSTLFPRIPVPIQKDLESKLSEWRARTKTTNSAVSHEPDLNDADKAAENHWDKETHQRKSSHSESKPRDSGRSAKDSRYRDDVADEIAREKDRQRRERHEKSSKHHHHHHHSSKRHKHSSHRSRSRSPGGFDHKHSRHRSRSRSPTDSHRHHSRRTRSKTPSDMDYKHSSHRTRNSVERDPRHSNYRARSPVESDSRYSSNRSRSPADHRHRNHHRY